MDTADVLDGATWRVSSYTGGGNGGGGNCVELAPLRDGRVAVRNSNHRDAGTLLVTRRQLGGLLTALRAPDA